jgi:hypothetical protein
MLTPSGLRRVSSTSHITCASSPSNFGSATVYRVPLWPALTRFGFTGFASAVTSARRGGVAVQVTFAKHTPMRNPTRSCLCPPGLHFELSSYQPTSTDSGINPPGRFREGGGG